MWLEWWRTVSEHQNWSKVIKTQLGDWKVSRNKHMMRKSVIDWLMHRKVREYELYVIEFTFPTMIYNMGQHYCNAYNVIYFLMMCNDYYVLCSTLNCRIHKCLRNSSIWVVWCHSSLCVRCAAQHDPIVVYLIPFWSWQFIIISNFLIKIQYLGNFVMIQCQVLGFWHQCFT